MLETKNEGPGPKKPILERARADLQAGRPDKARDRLTGHLRTLQQRGKYNAEIYALLGEVHFAMQNFAHAGAAWLLTERDGADVNFAVKAFFERHNVHDHRNILRALKPRLPLEAFPPRVQERLAEWGYQPRPSRAEREAEQAAAKEVGSGVRPIEAGCILVCGLLVLLVMYYIFLMRGGPR